MILEEVIRRNIKRVLDEGISDRLYHFTLFDSGLAIMESDKLIFMSNKEKRGGEKVNRNVLSFTRNRMSNQGFGTFYDGDSIMRFQVDGQRIGHEHRGSAYNDFSFEDTLHTYDYWQQREHHWDEMEDRVYPKKNEDALEPFSDYVVRVDAYLTGTNRFQEESMRKLAEIVKGSPYEGKVYLYKGVKDFNFQTENCERL